MDSSLQLATVRPRRARPLTRIDRAAVGGLVLGLPALAIAYAAQGFLQRQPPYLVEGFLLLFGAALVFARAARTTLLAEWQDGTVARPAWFVGRRPRVGTLLFLGAVALNVIGLALFSLSWSADRIAPTQPAFRQTDLAWLVYLASLALGLAAAYELDGRPSVPALLWRNRGTVAVLGVLVAVAALLRFYRLADLPDGLWFDEARDGLETLKIMNSPTFRPVYAFFVDEPALKLYATVPFFWIFGPTQLALRIPTAIAGTLGVVAVFLLGRALLGRTVGIVAAGIIATMSWHVTFSRIGFNAVYSVALDALAMALLIFGLRTGRRSYMAVGGVALGLGLNSYYVTRLMAPVLLLYLAHRLITGRREFIRRNLQGLVVFALFTVMAAGPLGLYALSYPKEFTARATNASIQREIREQNSYQPLVDNIRKHLLMFNVRGDGNGRHNLPGEPMLERATAALAVIGLVMALRRSRRAEFFVLPVWSLFMLLGGILSLAFEAPQSLRTIDETVAAALLAALPVAAVAELVGRLAGKRSVRVLAWPAPMRLMTTAAIVAVALIGIGVSNVDRYFVRQASNFSSWNAHSTAETYIGRKIAAGKTVGSVFIGETMMEQPSIKFLAPGYDPHVKFDPATTLPLRDPNGATIFVEGEQGRSIENVRRLYPDAEIETLQYAGGGPPVLYGVRVTPDQVRRLQGVQGRYWPGTSAEGEPLARGRVPSIDLAAGTVPVPAPYYAEWKGTLAAPRFGAYAFKLDGPPTLVLRIDENEVLRGQAEATLQLARGNHAISVVGTVEADAPIRLLWRPPERSELQAVPVENLFVDPVTNNGLLGSYYNGLGWTGQPGLMQIDPSLQIRFHLLPLPRPYSVEWRGKIYLPTDGSYRFGSTSVDESWIYLDEQLLVDNSRNPGTYVEGLLPLKAGYHDIRIRYTDRTGHTYVNVFWTPPGRAREAIPTELLFPPMGAYPEKVTLAPPPPPLPTGSAAPIAVPAPGFGSGPVPGAIPPGAAVGAAAGIRPGQAPPAPPPAAPVVTKPGAAVGGPRIAVDLLATIGDAGAEPGRFNQPRAAAFGRDGSLYVADTANHRVQKLDANGQPVATWGTAADLSEPLGLVVDSSGRVIVLESESGWLKRYTADGQLVDQFGGPDGRFYHPRGLAIDPADNLYVADTGGGRIVKYNGKGEQVGVIGAKGNGAGQIAEPTGVAADAQGGVWVADAAGAKLIRYGPTGAPEVEIPLAKSGSFNGPHLALTANGTVVATDPEAGRISVFGPDGAARGVIQSEGLRRPVGVSVAPDGRIVVGDVDRQQVFILAPLPGSGS